MTHAVNAPHTAFTLQLGCPLAAVMTSSRLPEVRHNTLIVQHMQEVMSNKSSLRQENDLAAAAIEK